MLVLLSVLNDNYIEPLFTRRDGQVLLAIGLGFLLLGNSLMSRMTVLDY
jgi:Flp pilus assembly protein TadB